jgi:hypothetical protein
LRKLLHGARLRFLDHGGKGGIIGAGCHVSRACRNWEFGDRSSGWESKKQGRRARRVNSSKLWINSG